MPGYGECNFPSTSPPRGLDSADYVILECGDRIELNSLQISSQSRDMNRWHAFKYMHRPGQPKQQKMLSLHDWRPPL